VPSALITIPTVILPLGVLPSTMWIPFFTRSQGSKRWPCHAQAVSRWLPTAVAGFEAGSGHVGFVVDKVALGAGFLRVLRFILPTAPHSPSSSRAGTIGQSVADVPSGLSLSAPQETKKRQDDRKTTHGGLRHTT
jgi:hypothetical protein